MAVVVPLEWDGDGERYERDLAKLRMPYPALLQAVGTSNTERRLCSPHSAKTAPGYYAYNGMVSGLTTGLRPHGYERIDLGGVLPLWVNAELGVKLGLTSGNPMSGVRVSKHQPKSRYPKGELIRQMVERNQQPEWALFDLAVDAETDTGPLADYDLWLMLMYFDKAKSEIRYEISRPVDINSRGIIVGWNPRIVLPPYIANDLSGEDPNEGFGEIDVPVEPR